MALPPNANRQAAIEAIARAVRRVVERTSVDPELRRRLVADPRTVLAEHGVTIPAGMAVEVTEAGNADVVAALGRMSAEHLVLPLPALQNTPLSDDQLDGVVGGVDFRATALYYAVAPLAVARALVTADGAATAHPPSDDGAEQR